MRTIHVSLAILAGLLVWAGVTALHSALTARGRFYRQLDNALWDCRQQSGERAALDPADRRRLVEQLRSPNEYERWQAAAKLASWGETSAVPKLVAAMLDDDGTRRTCVIAQSLGALGSRAAVPALLGALNHPANLDLRVCATHALADIGDERAVPVLAQRAGDRSVTRDDYVSAIIALGDLGSAEGLPVLREIAAHDSDPQLRSLAAKAAGRVGMLTAADPAAALLAKLNAEDDWNAHGWILGQLALRWDARVAEALNDYLGRDGQPPDCVVQAAALLLHHGALTADTSRALQTAGRPKRWLAEYAQARVPSGRLGVEAATVAAAGEFKHTNRLINEKSPYLLQHAHNPVDWFPWGEAAFAKARQENKPIFLSVGYSTCHWCHVMERESFETEEIAKILNEHFVSIKVDREERPDVDRVYMTYVQATTGGGGWPMSVWLTPNLKPFVGGTYYPPEDRWGRPGFKSILLRIADAWKNDREKIVASADNVTRQLQQFTAVRADASAALEKSLLDRGYEQIKGSYESRYGGFGGAPKFPRPVTLNFMLRYHARSGATDALDMTLFTLRKMADGGMHDHIGGGFHRYSVDNEWHVPHFEKMLYDQAQLVGSYLEAYQITHEKFYADVARDVLDYVLRDMTGKDGQFYSAEDADSEGVEGKFYVWEQSEIVDALGGPSSREAAEIFNYYYGVEKNGNAPSDPHDEFRNKNILIVRHTIEDTAKQFGKSPDEIRDLLANARGKLWEIRAQRPRPHLDDKTITAWNGLMISAFARAYQALAEPRYLETATKATAFIESRLSDEKTGKLLRRYRQGETAIDGFVDDYAFLIQGLIDLYEASFDVRWLTWAIELQKQQNALFWDKDGGGYFSTTGADASVILRMKDDYDGAEPSPNSVAALNLLRLSQMTDNREFREMAERTLQVFGSRLQLRQRMSGMPQMLVAFDFHLDKPKQIIIAGRPEAADTRAMLREVHARFIPNKILLLADGGAGQKTLAGYIEFIKGVQMIDGKATAFVCENYVCKLPTTDPTTMIGLLVGNKPTGGR